MPAWRALLVWMGFASVADSLGGPELSQWQVRGLVCLRRVYGLVWLYDAWTASSGPTRHALAAFLGLPFSSSWVHLAGTGILLLDLYIAFALLFGKSLRTALWIGLVYLLVLWLAVERGGDFDPSAGGTDIGLGIPYLLLLIFVCAGQQMVSATARGGSTATGNFWTGASRVLFGFVWAWDALYKLRPHFLKTHIAASCAWRYVGSSCFPTSTHDRRQPCHFTQRLICIPPTACWRCWMKPTSPCGSVVCRTT